MAIENLTQIDELAESDNVPLSSSTKGGDFRVTLSQLADYIKSIFPAPPFVEDRYSSPSATGFTVTLTPTVAGASQFLKLTPTGAFAAGTIVLPPLPVNQQEVTVFTTQAITTLTVSTIAQPVLGAPTTLAANGYFRLRFEGVGNTWVRIG